MDAEGKELTMLEKAREKMKEGEQQGWVSLEEYAIVAQAESLERMAVAQERQAAALELLVGKRGIVHTANTQAE